MDDGRSRADALRKARIERFAKRQRQVHAWVNLAEIAEYCAREGGSIVPDETKRVLAYDDLTQEILNGAFEENGRSTVLFLNPGVSKARLTRDWLKNIIEFNYDGDGGRRGYLPYCWARRELVERWFERRRLAKPAEWFAARSSSADANAQRRKPSKATEAAQALRRLFPCGRPSLNLKELAHELSIKAPEIGAVSPRTLSRASALAWQPATHKRAK
jgi:hypothetical protein